MKPKPLIFLGISLVLVFLLFIFLKGSNSIERVCFEDNCVKVEVADNTFERQRGLMFRESLGDDEGMLFVFEENGKHSFWMKNTLIGLDIIWIDEDFRVVDFDSMEPCVESEGNCRSYVPCCDAKYVLEVNSGFVDDKGVEVGDVLRFE